MKEAELQNKTQPLNTPINIQYCDTFFCRLRGLTFQKSLPPNWGLLLVQSKDSRLDSAIHMMFMKIDLAIVWITSEFEVVDVQSAYKWKSFITPKKPAKYILEFPLDRLADFKVGDHVQITHPPHA